MTKKMRKAFFALVLLCILAGSSGCATTPSVGVGYYVPMSPHDATGMGFGIGF